MLQAFVLAFGELGDPKVRGVLVRTVGIALLLFVALGVGLWFGIGALPRFESDWLNTLVAVFSGLGLVFGLALVFPAVVTALLGLFLDDVAAAVESRHYSQDPPGRPLAFAPAAWEALRFAGVTLLLNLLALPLYIIGFLFPPLSLFVFCLLNGYLLGREYFDAVAWRHLDRTAARALRLRFRGRILLGGAAIAAMFVVPLVNLVAPVVATAFMVHVFKALPRRTPVRTAAP